MKRFIILFFIVFCFIGISTYASFKNYDEAYKSFIEVGDKVIELLDKKEFSQKDAYLTLDTIFNDKGYLDYIDNGILYIYKKIKEKIDIYGTVSSNMNIKASRILFKYKELVEAGTIDLGTGNDSMDVDDDIDNDGIKNSSDEDIDGDGKLNKDDTDIDGDSISNEDDRDVDGDGLKNINDVDMDSDGIKNIDDIDMDGDGKNDVDDPDVDGDGVSNGDDPDIDGDEIFNGDDPDVDGDGVLNGDDPDVDGDGKLNKDDTDIDGDDILNESDKDIDGDGKLNGNDVDVDGDALLNSGANETDIDGDGVENKVDEDMDGDGMMNIDDEDMDGDGVKNSEDKEAYDLGVFSSLSGSIIEEQKIYNSTYVMGEIASKSDALENMKALKDDYVKRYPYFKRSFESIYNKYLKDLQNTIKKQEDKEKKKPLRGEELISYMMTIQSDNIISELDIHGDYNKAREEIKKMRTFFKNYYNTKSNTIPSKVNDWYDLYWNRVLLYKKIRDDFSEKGYELLHKNEVGKITGLGVFTKLEAIYDSELKKYPYYPNAVKELLEEFRKIILANEPDLLEKMKENKLALESKAKTLISMIKKRFKGNDKSYKLAMWDMVITKVNNMLQKDIDDKVITVLNNLIVLINKEIVNIRTIGGKSNDPDFYIKSIELNNLSTQTDGNQYHMDLQTCNVGVTGFDLNGQMLLKTRFQFAFSDGIYLSGENQILSDSYNKTLSSIENDCLIFDVIMHKDNIILNEGVIKIKFMGLIGFTGDVNINEQDIDNNKFVQEFKRDYFIDNNTVVNENNGSESGQLDTGTDTVQDVGTGSVQSTTGTDTVQDTGTGSVQSDSKIENLSGSLVGSGA